MFGILKTWKVFYFLFLFLFFFLLDVMTWNVKCYSLHFFLLPIWIGIFFFHRIEHTKLVKQGQDCQNVIAKKSLRIYIYIFIYFFITIVFSIFDLLDFFNLENVWYKSIKSWKTFHHILCNNCLEFRRLGKSFFIFYVLEVKTWKVKCYSLPFFLLPICSGKNLHRIEHTKRIKQGQDCQSNY